MKIGLGIITCNRPHLLEKLLRSINGCNWAEMIVINDGDPVKIDGFNYYIHDNERNLGVAKSKNKALKHLMAMGCEHIFLIEDDMYIKDESIFDKYIEASEKSGIHHLMFGYHGPANKNGISHGKPCPRLVVDYGDFSLAFNQHCVGAFCYYSRKCLEDVGLIDEKFRNAFDHVSHSYELAQKGYSTPYWWWADLANSIEYIEEQVCSEESSSIKTPEREEEWANNIRNSMEYFKDKFGMYPFGKNGVEDSTQEEVLKFLKNAKR